MNNLSFLKNLSAIVLIGYGLMAGCPTPPALAAGPLEPKKTIAVVEFAVRGSDLDPQAGAIIADSMTSAIASLGYFALKDRMSLSAIAKIAKNSQLGSIGPIDAETAMQLGKLYGIHGIVTGTISRLGDRVRVTARLIDTRTGTVLRSGEIEDKDIDAVQVKLNKLVMSITTIPVSSPPSGRALTVKTEPANATVKLLNFSQSYQAGIRLPAGAYEIEVSHPGYVTQKASARIAENDVTMLINLQKNRYALTVEVEPPESRISILDIPNIPKPYQPGMKLEAGVYQLEIACPGYQTQQNTITITDADLNVVLKLKPQNDHPAAPVRPPQTQTFQSNPAVQRQPVKKSAPRPTRSTAARGRTDKPATQGGAFKQELRKFRDNLKRAFW